MPRTRAKSHIFIAKQTFWCTLDGEATLIRKDERVRDGHPLLRMHPENFEQVDTTVKYDVEQATAAPGEVRG